MPDVTEERTMTMDEALQYVGIESETLSPEIIMSGFEAAWKGKPQDRKGLILAKNTLLQMLVSQQMEKQRYFEIVSPFENSCISCRGTGEIYKFMRKPVKVNCHICAGKKKVNVTCRKCEGSGRYIERWPEGGGINVECMTCKGKGKVRVKCSHCFGKGKIKKIVPDHHIKSTTPCKHCDELGFILPKPIKKKKHETPPIGNPVISEENAAALSEMIRD